MIIMYVIRGYIFIKGHPCELLSSSIKVTGWEQATILMDTAIKQNTAEGCLYTLDEVGENNE